MARRKKNSQKPASASTVIASPVVQETSEVSRTAKDHDAPEDIDDEFKDSMVDFPDFGSRDALDSERDPSGVLGTRAIGKDKGVGEDDFLSQAKDKWSQFRSLLPNQGGAKLTFEEPIVKEGIRIAQVDLDEIQVETSFWNSAVVCMVLGANPPFAIFEGFVKRIWGKLGIERISRLNSSLTLVKFRDEATRDLVLEAGVLHFDRKPVIVKPWSADLNTLKAVKTVPVWIRLPGLGLQYWGTKFLSALVSTTGNPLLVDKVTKERSMMQFVRVLVEIEIAEDLPKSIQFLNEKGQLMEQLLEYEWLPTQCRGCKVFGHTVSMCNRKPTEVWRQKGHTGIVETQRGNTEQQPVSEEMNVTSGEKVDVTKDVDDKGLDAGQGLSQSQAQVRNADHTDVAPDSNVTVTDKLEWSAPKRGGVLKRVNRKIQSNLRNSYGVLQDKIGLGAFLETKLYGEKIGKMMSTSFRGCNYYSGTNSEGRILVLWLPQVVTVEILMESDQFVHILVKGINSSKGNDRVGGRIITAVELEDARNWRALGLVDELRSLGSHFTWTNNQENDNRIYSKLDRVFKNEEWLDLYPQAEALFNWDLLSDHCYCIIKMGAANNSGLKPFRFFNMWTEHRSFNDTVLQSWNKPIKGRGLVRIVRKLSRLKVVLCKFNKLVVGDVAMHYNLAKEKFQNAQGLLQRNPHSTELQREEALAGACLAYHSKAYDSFLRQKSKVDWLRFGDDNTNYFHECLKQRRANNYITLVVSESGELIEKFEDVVTHFVHHFQKIMGSSSNASVPVQSSCFRLGHCLSLEQQVKPVRPFTK
ncbi:uncharacterized protein LOC133778793 [Humulus lupulus]|uniref:uncharacterized protein LOC133778793 n=1 Tax=Humulus lupulus TaxID=3486 RepID=UPI002B403C6C|nr:uncharacterized protein LOC133778793 [Humulus lupulus]